MLKVHAIVPRPIQPSTLYQKFREDVSRYPGTTIFDQFGWPPETESIYERQQYVSGLLKLPGFDIHIDKAAVLQLLDLLDSLVGRRGWSKTQVLDLANRRAIALEANAPKPIPIGPLYAEQQNRLRYGTFGHDNISGVWHSERNALTARNNVPPTLEETHLLPIARITSKKSIA